MVLMGPANPDQFRQQVGRYGDRFYVDNLPPCELHTPEKPPRPLPSVSVVKNQWPKHLTAWAGRQAAEYAYDHQAAWRTLDRDAAVDLIANASDRMKNRAAKRGTDVHTFAETLAEGRRPDWTMADDNVMPFRAAIEKMVRDLKITPIVSEAVVFNHGIGYGGTFDVIADTIHGRGLLDYKSRMKHQPYPEEACQVSAYMGGDYMIVEIDGQAVRKPIPDVDFLAIITITPDGFRVHEVNEQDAWNTWKGVSHFFHAKNGSKFYDGVLATPAAPTVSVDNIRDRIVALSDQARKYLAQQWPQDLPTLKQQPTVSDVYRIDQLVTEVEAKVSAQFAFNPPPDECGTLDPKVYTHIMAVLKTLPDDIQGVVEYFLASTKPDIRMRKMVPTARRYEILRLLIYAAEAGHADMEAVTDLLPDDLGHLSMENAIQRADQLRERLAGDHLSELVQRNSAN
jgi:hypothetical protein